MATSSGIGAAQLNSGGTGQTSTSCTRPTRSCTARRSAVLARCASPAASHSVSLAALWACRAILAAASGRRTLRAFGATAGSSGSCRAAGGEVSATPGDAALTRSVASRLSGVGKVRIDPFDIGTCPFSRQRAACSSSPDPLPHHRELVGLVRRFGAASANKRAGAVLLGGDLSRVAALALGPPGALGRRFAQRYFEPLVDVGLETADAAIRKPEPRRPFVDLVQTLQRSLGDAGLVCSLTTGKHTLGIGSYIAHGSLRYPLSRQEDDGARMLARISHSYERE